MTDLQAAADALLAARDRAARLPLLTAAGEFTLEDAYSVGELIRQRRIARGERPLGYKIGFTNRGIWARYGVYAPIWAPVWDSTVRSWDGDSGTLSLKGLVQPRLEPEVVFGFASPPEAGMSDQQLTECLAWVAHGLEVVNTHFDDWRFAAADTVADFALHGALIVGPHCALERFSSLSDELADLHVELWCDGQRVDQGDGRAVLDSPLQALKIWLGSMAAQTPAWKVEAGDIVTTGTITDAWPMRPGQQWQTRLSDARMTGLSLHLTD